MEYIFSLSKVNMAKSIYSKEQQQLTNKIRVAREEKGLTQLEAAKLVKKTQSYISKIESGQRKIDIIQLKEFSKIYNKDINFFLKK